MLRMTIALAGVALLAGVLAGCGSSDSSGAAASDTSDGALAEGLAALLADGNGAASGISVSGQGSASAAPDVATLSVGVSALADTAGQARDEAAASMADLIDSLESNGIDGDDYHTTQFSIEPQIDYRPNGEQVLRGYRVTNMLSVTVREIDRVGEVIDDAVDAAGDAVRVQGVTFGIEDMSALKAEARETAMAEAKAKAEALAELAGVGLGRPTAISESSAGGPPVFFDAARLQEAAETPISPGQLEVTVTVAITYAIS